MKDVMLDLETLGTRPGSVIISIGAVFFDPRSGELGKEFHEVIDADSSLYYGFTSDPETIEWWEKQSDEAKATYNLALRRDDDLGESIATSLTNFTSWLGEENQLKNVRVWGNGAAFDNALLSAAYHRLGLNVPWRFTNDRCFRTLKSLFGANGVEPTNRGVKHNALEDAKHQARWACEILQLLTPPIPNPRAKAVPGLGLYRDKESLGRDFKVASAPHPNQIMKDAVKAAGKLRQELINQNEINKSVHDTIVHGTGAVKLSHVPVQGLMPDPPEGYVNPVRVTDSRSLGAAVKEASRGWPICPTCHQPLTPTPSGLVCESGHDTSHGR